MKHFWLFLLFCVVAASATAAPKKIFVWKDENGVLVFSDTPRVNASELKLTTNPNIADKPDTSVFDNVDAVSTEAEVFNVEIVKPAANSTIRDNNGSVYVSANVTPRFKRGLTAKLFFDGKLYAEQQGSAIFIMRNVDRGEHTIYMQLVDSGKVIATSPTTTFYLHRQSVITPN